MIHFYRNFQGKSDHLERKEITEQGETSAGLLLSKGRRKQQGLEVRGRKYKRFRGQKNQGIKLMKAVFYFDAHLLEMHTKEIRV